MARAPKKASEATFPHSMASRATCGSSASSAMALPRTRRTRRSQRLYNLRRLSPSEYGNLLAPHSPTHACVSAVSHGLGCRLSHPSWESHITLQLGGTSKLFGFHIWPIPTMPALVEYPLKAVPQISEFNALQSNAHYQDLQGRDAPLNCWRTKTCVISYTRMPQSPGFAHCVSSSACRAAQASDEHRPHRLHVACAG